MALSNEKAHGKVKKALKKTLLVLNVVMIVGLTAGHYLLRGPVPYFRELLITTAMTTMHHQYIAYLFYTDAEINAVMARNTVETPKEKQNTDLIKIPDQKEPEPDPTPLQDSSEDHKITGNTLIDVSRDGCSAWLLEVPDASKVHLAVTNQYGKSGQLLTGLVKNFGGVAGINGGGFVDPQLCGPAATAMGALVAGGKVYSGSGGNRYSIVGINKRHVLILDSLTIAEMREQGVEDAVEFGPFLIKNGVPSVVRGNGGWGLAPRTAIGQKQDGTFLFLVVDGRRLGSKGCDIKLLIDIMQEYGAVNAANLDGGGSTAMYFGGKVVNKPCANDGDGLRRINNAFIVTQ